MQIDTQPGMLVGSGSVRKGSSESIWLLKRLRPVLTEDTHHVMNDAVVGHTTLPVAKALH